MKIIFLLMFFLLTNCAGETIRNIKVNNLSIREYTTSQSCDSGTHHSIYLIGEINDDSVAILEKVLSSMPECIKNNRRIVPSIYLKSKGGYLSDGFKVGELFSRYSVQTIIGDGDECMSACSTAFLGGKFRTMEGSAKLMVHAPYYYLNRYTIECQSTVQAANLKNYYIQRLGTNEGETLFNRTMRYCSTTEGWTLNKDAAKLFGITTN
jgi:ATP-dependent protease ClpP protease subunit